MFFYVSFLRPPPTHAASSRPIQITPQIANDLRTESYQQSQDLYYSWIPIQSDLSEKNFAIATKPIKLTTWRPENAYKPIQVPPPPNVRPGQYALGLSGGPNSAYIDMLKLQHSIFPVVSMPILFAPSVPKNVGKQERIERIYSIPQQRLGDSEAEPITLKITEQTSFDLDKKIWDSGIGTSGWLVSLYVSEQEHSQPKDIVDLLTQREPLNIVELGAGTGIVSVVLGTLRSLLRPEEEENDKIFVTDLPSAQPLLAHNLATNASKAQKAALQANVLDWDEELLPADIEATSLDLILHVMADVTYNTASFPSLLRTLTMLLDKSAQSTPWIILGYKQRDIAERTLFTLIRDAPLGIELIKVGISPGMGGEPVEIWAGRRN